MYCKNFTVGDKANKEFYSPLYPRKYPNVTTWKVFFSRELLSIKFVLFFGWKTTWFNFTTLFIYLGFNDQV